MPQNLSILNSKQRKRILAQLEEQYGFSGSLDYVFLLQETKQKIYLFTKDLAKLDLSDLRVDSMGLYFGAIFEGKIRLTIEGSQLVGPQAEKNIVSVGKEAMQRWMQGEKLLLSGLDEDGFMQGDFVLLRYGDDFLGCGKVSGDAIANYIPKTRYVHALYD